MMNKKKGPQKKTTPQGESTEKSRPQKQNQQIIRKNPQLFSEIFHSNLTEKIQLFFPYFCVFEGDSRPSSARTSDSRPSSARSTDSTRTNSARSISVDPTNLREGVVSAIKSDKGYGFIEYKDAGESLWDDDFGSLADGKCMAKEISRKFRAFFPGFLFLVSCYIFFLKNRFLLLFCGSFLNFVFLFFTFLFLVANFVFFLFFVFWLFFFFLLLLLLFFFFFFFFASYFCFTFALFCFGSFLLAFVALITIWSLFFFFFCLFVCFFVFFFFFDSAKFFVALTRSFCVASSVYFRLDSVSGGISVQRGDRVQFGLKNDKSGQAIAISVRLIGAEDFDEDEISIKNQSNSGPSVDAEESVTTCPFLFCFCFVFV